MRPAELPEDPVSAVLVRTARAAGHLDWTAGASALETFARLLVSDVVPVLWPRIAGLPADPDAVRGLRVTAIIPPGGSGTALLATPSLVPAMAIPDCKTPGCRCGGRAVQLAALRQHKAAVFLHYWVRVDATQAVHTGFRVVGASGGEA